MSSEIFKTDNKLEGVLIGIIADPDTYLVRFPYTKDGIKAIKVGGYIGVENFHSEPDIKKYSVLTIVKSNPVHYALGSKATNLIDEYYGFVEIAAKNLSRDWEQEEPEEEVTRIQVEAVPIGIMIEKARTPDAKIELPVDVSSPLLGGTARLLTDEMIKKVINKDVPIQNGVELGSLIANENVGLKINASKLCNSHIGLFGFTRSGKTNLTSNLVTQMLKSTDGKKKIIITDYTNEYFPLLADCFDKMSDSYLLFLDPERLQESTDNFNLMLSDDDARRQTANKIISNMTLQDLQESSSGLEKILVNVLKRGGVKVFVPQSIADEAREKIQAVIATYDLNILGRIRRAALSWPYALGNAKIKFTPENIGDLADYLDTKLKAEETIGFNREITSTDIRDIVDQNNTAYGLTTMQKMCVQQVINQLKQVKNNWLYIESLDPQLKITLVELSNLIDCKKQNLLIVATSERTDDLASFFATVTNHQYFRRRSGGVKEPSVLFFLDEADEFIPPETAARGLIAKSRQEAERLARRSGKFAMGLGIATQRVGYIDSKVMGQLHTYFVSKLPRREDRAKVAEAFGIETEHIDKTLSLNTGEWLIISHSALGIPITPIFAKFKNAEERIKKYIQEKGYINTNSD
ncbi:MAG: ATP-binding protein [Candidatus Heimdallarchaeaceae archaeon]